MYIILHFDILKQFNALNTTEFIPSRNGVNKQNQTTCVCLNSRRATCYRMMSNLYAQHAVNRPRLHSTNSVKKIQTLAVLTNNFKTRIPDFQLSNRLYSSRNNSKQINKQINK